MKSSKPPGSPPSRPPHAPNVISTGRFQVASTDPAQFTSTFDLPSELAHHIDRYSVPDASTSQSWIYCYKLPRFVIWNIERVTSTVKASTEAALCACTSFGVGQLFKSDELKAWAAITEIALSTATQYATEDDFSDVMSIIHGAKLTLNDGRSGIHRRNFRSPEEIRRQVYGAAKAVGVSASVMAQIAIMDGLRLQEDAMDKHRTLMDELTEEFYGDLTRRTRKLENLLIALGVSVPGRKKP